MNNEYVKLVETVLKESIPEVVSDKKLNDSIVNKLNTDANNVDFRKDLKAGTLSSKSILPSDPRFESKLIREALGNLTKGSFSPVAITAEGDERPIEAVAIKIFEKIKTNIDKKLIDELLVLFKNNMNDVRKYLVSVIRKLILLNDLARNANNRDGKYLFAYDATLKNPKTDFVSFYSAAA
jgi:hypothetical protein